MTQSPVALAIESDSLVPLPVTHRNGFTAISVSAGLSVFSAFSVLLYLTVKLVRWHIKTRGQGRRPSNGRSPVDLSLGLAQHHFTAGNAKRRGSRNSTRNKAHPNQFLVLVFNLLLADMHQAIGYGLSMSASTLSPWEVRITRSRSSGMPPRAG